MRIFVGLALVSSVLLAKEVPEGTVFNKTCPAPKACEPLVTNIRACQKKDREACKRFVAAFEKLLPEYDCHRSFDQNHVVPAIWLCGEAQSDGLVLLSEMKMPAARKLFMSNAFRASLDGELAELYQDLRMKTGGKKK